MCKRLEMVNGKCICLPLQSRIATEKFERLTTRLPVMMSVLERHSLDLAPVPNRVQTSTPPHSSGTNPQSFRLISSAFSLLSFSVYPSFSTDFFSYAIVSLYHIYSVIATLPQTFSVREFAN